MYFCVNEFEVGVNDSIFSGNEQQKVYYIILIKQYKIYSRFIKFTELVDFEWSGWTRMFWEINFRETFMSINKIYLLYLN